MWTLVINSEYRGHIRGGHVGDELTPLMIFLTTDFDYRCAKLGTIFTEERKLTEEEIAKLSDTTLSRTAKVEIATAFIKKFTGEYAKTFFNVLAEIFLTNFRAKN